MCVPTSSLLLISTCHVMCTVYTYSSPLHKHAHTHKHKHTLLKFGVKNTINFAGNRLHTHWPHTSWILLHTFNCTRGTNSIHTWEPWYNTCTLLVCTCTMYMHAEIHITQDNGGYVPVHVFQCQGYLTFFSQVLKPFSSVSKFVDVLLHHTLYLQWGIGGIPIYCSWSSPVWTRVSQHYIFSLANVGSGLQGRDRRKKKLCTTHQQKLGVSLL